MKCALALVWGGVLGTATACRARPARTQHVKCGDWRRPWAEGRARPRGCGDAAGGACQAGKLDCGLRTSLPLYKVCAHNPAAILPCHSLSAHASGNVASAWKLPSWKFQLSVWSTWSLEKIVSKVFGVPWVTAMVHQTYLGNGFIKYLVHGASQYIDFPCIRASEKICLKLSQLLHVCISKDCSGNHSWF